MQMTILSAPSLFPGNRKLENH